MRLQRAAGQLKSAATHLEHVAGNEGITVPIEIRRALATVRQWTLKLGAREPDPPVLARPTTTSSQSGSPARPRRRDAWRLRAP